MSNNSLLTVKDLVVEYTSDKVVTHAVNGVSFELERGKILGLVGETGAGKTTIAKTILSVLPELQAKVPSGEIIFEGKDILKMSEKELMAIRGHKISMIFQDPMTALNPIMRVGNQIAEAILLHNKVSKKEAEKRAKEMLRMVGIPEDRFMEYPFQFSGGMKQRVVIAIALACEPALLLADEPTTALDVTIQAQVLEMVKDLVVSSNTSMILITHDLGIVAENCNEVATIYAGEIVEYGEVREVFTNPTHPYTRSLLAALPRLDDENFDRLSPIDGLPPDPSDLPSGCSFSPRCPEVCERCCAEHPGMIKLSDNHYCRCFAVEKGQA